MFYYGQLNYFKTKLSVMIILTSTCPIRDFTLKSIIKSQSAPLLAHRRAATLPIIELVLSKY